MASSLSFVLALPFIASQSTNSFLSSSPHRLRQPAARQFTTRIAACLQPPSPPSPPSPPPPPPPPRTPPPSSSSQIGSPPSSKLESSSVQPTSTAPAPAPIPNPQHNVQDQEPSNIAADIRNTLLCVSLALPVALLFNRQSPAAALEFITAYIIEYALSVDNLLVFLLIFDYFRVPRSAQSRVLSFGLAGAVVMRAVFIVFGEALTKRFQPASLVFAAILLYSAANLLIKGDDDEDKDLSSNSIVKFVSARLPVSDEYVGNAFFTRQNGLLIATPLLLVLAVVELSDLLFAVDSVPAVLGVSDRVAVIYSSNVLAVLGLRSLYFVLADSIGEIRFLQPALAIVLAFIAGKMTVGVFGYEIPVSISLSVVVGTISTAVVGSFLFPSKSDDESETD